MAHRTEVLEQTNGTFTPICSCGWRSTSPRTYKAAKLLTNDHRVSEMSTPKPDSK